MIDVRIVADSINDRGIRLTSWLLTYPRFIHSELMTHRVASRNAASSRAVPLKKTIAMVIRKPAIPEHWGANQKGMQANGELSEFGQYLALRFWLLARWPAIAFAWLLSVIGLHKQLANRVLEPWLHITVLFTMTDHRNFFSLRAHKDAQPEFQVLAFRMLAEYVVNQPTYVARGHWHFPIIGQGDSYGANFADFNAGGERTIRACHATTAAAARTSYYNFDKPLTTEDAMRIHNQLVEVGHWSPLEHCAQSMDAYGPESFSNFDQCGVKSGWLQYRKTFPGENRTEVNLADLLKQKPDWVIV